MAQGLGFVNTPALGQRQDQPRSLLPEPPANAPPPYPPGPGQPGLGAAGGSSEEARRPQHESCRRRRCPELHHSPAPAPRPPPPNRVARPQHGSHPLPRTHARVARALGGPEVGRGRCQTGASGKGTFRFLSRTLGGRGVSVVVRPGGLFWSVRGTARSIFPG